MKRNQQTATVRRPPARGRRQTITPSEFHERIRARAHEFYVQRGYAPGKELDDWVHAERQIKQEFILS